MGIMIFMLKSQRRAFRWPNNLRARLYIVHYTLYIIAQFIYLVRVRINKCGPSTLYSVTSTVQCTLYTVHCIPYSVHCTLYVYSVLCTEEVLLKRDHI